MHSQHAENTMHKTLSNCSETLNNCLLGASLEQQILNMCHLGASWGHRGGFVGGLGSNLEPLRCAWGHLGGLVASLAVLGASLGRLGIDLGASWAIVDVLGGLLGVSWGLLRALWGSWVSSCVVSIQKVGMSKHTIKLK